MIVVGDAERSSLYDSGSGVLGAREKLGIVYAFVSKVIENGDSSLDLLEEIQSNTEKWKARSMASYSSIFVSKTTTCPQWTELDQYRSGAVSCTRELSGLTVSANELSAFEIRGADDDERRGGEYKVRFVENDRGKGGLRSRSRKRKWETWGDVWGM